MTTNHERCDRYIAVRIPTALFTRMSAVTRSDRTVSNFLRAAIVALVTEREGQ